jgi:gamma-glutamyltranspeptidase
VVSYIHSLHAGNGVVAGDTGILLNNRMGCFSLDPSSPNRLARMLTGADDPRPGTSSVIGY